MVTRVSPHLEVDMASLEAFCDKWGISRLGVFGSVLRDDFTLDSDVDVLVSFQPDRWPSLTQRSVAEDELSAILGHRAEMVIREGLEGWRVSPSVRDNILSEVREVYINDLFSTLKNDIPDLFKELNQHGFIKLD